MNFFTPQRKDASRNRTFVVLLHHVGLTDHEIALHLGLSTKTVYRHRHAEFLPVNRSRWGTLTRRAQ